MRGIQGSSKKSESSWKGLEILQKYLRVIESISKFFKKIWEFSKTSQGYWNKSGGFRRVSMYFKKIWRSWEGLKVLKKIWEFSEASQGSSIKSWGLETNSSFLKNLGVLRTVSGFFSKIWGFSEVSQSSPKKSESSMEGLKTLQKYLRVSGSEKIWRLKECLKALYIVNLSKASQSSSKTSGGLGRVSRLIKKNWEFLEASEGSLKNLDVLRGSQDS